MLVRSMTCYGFTLAKCNISWNGIQFTSRVALTTEAEYMAAS